MKYIRPALLDWPLGRWPQRSGVPRMAPAPRRLRIWSKTPIRRAYAYHDNPTAASIAKSAKAVLIFPNIVKAGLIFGGAYGEGVLERGSVVDGYYNSVTASWGLQAGRNPTAMSCS